MTNPVPMRQVFGETLRDLADEFPALVVLDADCSSSTQTRLFAERHPDRFFNCGIAEGHMVSMAAGMAAAGLTPVVSTFAFLLAGRAGDAVLSQIGYMKLNVKLAGGYCGLSDFADGASHQSIHDLAVMRAIPGMVVVSPADIVETRLAVRVALEHEGPVYLRLSRAEVGRIFDDAYRLTIGRGVTLRGGRDCTLVSTGARTAAALEAADRLAARGIAARVLHLPTVKPLDADPLRAAAAEAAPIFTIEEHSIIGGLGEAVAGLLSETMPVLVYRLGLHDIYGESGPYETLLDQHGLTSARIAERVERTLMENRNAAVGSHEGSRSPSPALAGPVTGATRPAIRSAS